MMTTKQDGDREFHRQALELQRLREDPANWDDEDARFFVAKLSELSRRSAENVLFRAMRSCRNRDAIRNMVGVLRALTASSEYWRTQLGKSLRKHGRCPKCFRTQLRQILGSRAGAPAAWTLDGAPARGVLPREPAAATGGPTSSEKELRGGPRERQAHRLDLGEEELGIFRLGSLFDKLHSVEQRVNVVEVTFTERIYPYGLAVIAAWLASRGIRAECSAADWAEKYIESIGFLVNGRPSEDMSPVYDHKNHLGFTPISSSYRFDTDQTVGRFLRLFEEHLPSDQTGRGALAIAVAELVENVHLHSQSTTPGYLVAQAHPTTRKLHVAVADAGIGIAASFRRGDNIEAKRSIRSDEDALLWACRPLVTSRVEGHAGYGLYLVSELAQRNGGTFVIASGNAMLRRWGRITWRGIKPQEDRGVHHGWAGTVIGLMLDLTRPIPIDDVYNELPLPRGYVREDFFE